MSDSHDNVRRFPVPTGVMRLTCRVVIPGGYGAALVLDVMAADMPVDARPGARVPVERDGVEFMVEIVAMAPLRSGGV